MIVFRPKDLFEIASGKFGLQVENEMQVRRHPFVLGCILPVDLTYHQQRIITDLESEDSECRCHPEAGNNNFVLCLIICSREAQGVGLLNDGPLWSG